MDPNASLAMILGMADQSVALRSEYAEALRGWLRRGGFSPRVEIHPATDAWMMGDRFGEIVAVGRKYLSVRMDRSGRVLKFAPSRIYTIV